MNAPTLAEVLQAAVRDAAQTVNDVESHLDELGRWSALIVATFERRGKVLVLGNGGSAAQAQHLAGELVGRFETDRRALPTIALTTDGTVLTSLANDFGFEQVFARQVAALATADDVVITISTSGRSPNVRTAMEAANAAGATVLCMLGKAAGTPAGAHRAISLAATSTARVQEGHLLLCHLLCTAIEHRLSCVEVEPQPASAGAAVPLADALSLVARWRADGDRVATTNGCFDLLHAGHVSGLQFARAQADRLVVLLNTDDSVRALKGTARPHIPFAQRAAVLAALRCVDLVVALADSDPRDLLDQLRPDVHCKGGDYAGQRLIEADVVERHGGVVVLAPLVPCVSTTALAATVQAAEPGDSSR